MHLFTGILIGLVVHWFNGFIPLALAGSDPLYATPSATATVPSFMVESDQVAPSTPILLRPVDHAVTGDPRPELVWRRSTDENSNAVLYTLYLNGVATFLGISGDGNSSGNGFTARVEAGDIRLLPTSPLPDGVYTWRVDAYDLSLNSSRSTTWSFTIDSTAPSLTIIDLDIYHEPTIIEGSNFDIAGPKDVYFTLHSEPYATIELSLTSLDSNVYHLSSPTNFSGRATLYQHLDPGLYSVIALAIDHAGNTVVLPEFTLSVIATTLTLPGVPPILVPAIIHDLPSTLAHLPATISQIDSRLRLSYYLATLLAVTTIILLIILWRRRYNLVLLNDQLRFLPTATIYHSIPNQKSNIYHLGPSDHGRLYIPHLNRYSTLTIRQQGPILCTTHILSICTPARLYTLVID